MAAVYVDEYILQQMQQSHGAAVYVTPISCTRLLAACKINCQSISAHAQPFIPGGFRSAALLALFFSGL
jgi:hypothetical protein